MKPRQSGGAPEVETKAITAWEMADLFQVIAAVYKQLKVNSFIKVPHVLYV